MALDFGLPLFCGGRGKEATEFLPPQIGSHSPLMRDYGKELGGLCHLWRTGSFSERQLFLGCEVWYGFRFQCNECRSFLS
jgi:hypothetical protein